MLPLYQSSYLDIVINVIANTGPPYFDPPLPINLTINACESFDYQLPRINDPDNDQGQIQSILFDKALLFTNQRSQTSFTFTPSIPEHFGVFPILIRLVDINKYPLVSKFTFSLVVNSSNCLPLNNLSVPNDTIISYQQVNLKIVSIS